MHLTLSQRQQIEHLLTEGTSQTVIAHVLGVHRSTVSREISRNTCPDSKVYKADYAEQIKRSRRHKANALRKRRSWVASSLCWRYLGRFGARGIYFHSSPHLRRFPPFEMTFNFSPRNNHYLPAYRFRPNLRHYIPTDWLHADVMQYVRNHRNYWHRKWLAPVGVRQAVPEQLVTTAEKQPEADQSNLILSVLMTDSHYGWNGIGLSLSQKMGA
ncbi:helix-turn-helix domain-containing protein [Limibacter armeniacum]|uniref:helix-turn-helix domain-containing protein n=1 Tax=Limibacter armeniacum TaxID=466084 RepID=UPI002FE63DD6